MAKFNLIVRKKRSGFSLVEITVALGIIAFAFVSIFGLLPTGLTTFRRAMDISISSQISQRLINDAQQTDFTTLKSTEVRYFDSDGAEVDGGTKNIVYHAVVWIKKMDSSDAAGSGSETLPHGGVNPNLARAVVQVANNPGNKVLATTNDIWEDTSLSIVTSSILIARQTK